MENINTATKSPNYIQKIEINGLFGYKDQNFSWDLYPDVNIIAGNNGSGKSTILKGIYNIFLDKEIELLEGLDIYFNEKKLMYFKKIYEENYSLQKLTKGMKNDEPKFSYIKTFDTELPEKEAMQELSNEQVKTFLDWEFWKLHEKYLNYQIDIGKRAIEALKNNKENLDKVNEKMELFHAIVEKSFKLTHKIIDKTSNYLSFVGKENKTISPYQLSSGEKQLLIILLTALVQDNQPCIMIMDEPEISLHTDWQELLIRHIRQLNPNIQLIIATHSPAIVADGWENNILEIPNF